MKIHSYIQENGKWVLKDTEMPALKHYWYSLQTVYGYYKNVLQDKWDEYFT